MNTSASSGTLFLLDAYALIFRAYYAFINSRMVNSKGVNTATIYGFTATLEDVLRSQKPTHIAVVFDPSGPTFRNELYKEYKANRLETPEGIKTAVPWIKRIIEAWGIPVIEVPGFEADDVIGTLARKAEAKGYLTYMMTPDKDYTQLVTGRTLIYKPGRAGNDAEVIGVEEVKKRFGVDDPSQVKDILALWGDSSDNVPGAPGIGEKGAIKLVSEYKSIENLYKNVEQLKEKTKLILLNNKQLIELSKTLVTIVCDVPVEFNEQSLEMNVADFNKIKELYQELEFRSLLNRIMRETGPQGGKEAVKKSGGVTQPSLFGEPPAAGATPVITGMDTAATVAHQYRLVDTPEKVQELVHILERQGEICFDTETSSLDVHNTEMVGMSFSIKAHEAWFVYLVGHNDLLGIFRPVLENPSIAKTGQNIKFDMEVLAHHGVHVCSTLFDTMVAHYLIQPEERHNMDYLAEKYLRYMPIPITDLIGEKGKRQRSMKDVDPQRLTEYAAEDADITWQLKQVLQEEMEQAGLTSLFNRIEMPLVNVLAGMECTGVKIDTGALQEYARVLNSEMHKEEQEIYRLAGEPFNISSPKQLGEILFEKLKITDTAKKTKTKQYATSEEVLTDLSDRHPIVPLILDYRSYKKLLSTYIEALPELINPRTGKIHTSFNQTIVATGRLSSTNPNLQNIPVRDERGREIRKAFVPSDPAGCLLSADYSQIELRLMAHISEDPAMIEAFLNGEDIHTATAAKIYGIPLNEVSREMRSKAKTANFGIIYGISAFGLSQRLRIPRAEADELIKGYFRTFPGVRRYMNDIIMSARDRGYVETLFGRRRYLPDITSHNANVRGMAERNAINAPIQGSAADIIKIAMINIYRRMQEEKLASFMVLQVHDELVFDVAPGETEKVSQIVKKEMENATSLRVPLTVDIGVGANWLEAH